MKSLPKLLEGAEEEWAEGARQHPQELFLADEAKWSTTTTTTIFLVASTLMRLKRVDVLNVGPWVRFVYGRDRSGERRGVFCMCGGWWVVGGGAKKCCCLLVLQRN